jgi:glycerol-3-phosphate acyltransferase PlsY
LGVFLLSGLLFALSRRLALAGLAAVAVSPVVMAVLGRTRGAIAGMTALAAMILIAHRTNIRRTLGEIRSGSAPKRNQAPGL